MILPRVRRSVSGEWIFPEIHLLLGPAIVRLLSSVEHDQSVSARDADGEGEQLDWDWQQKAPGLLGRGFLIGRWETVDFGIPLLSRRVASPLV